MCCDCADSRFIPEPYAFEAVTVSTTAVALTTATYQAGPAIEAFITNFGAAIRYRIDGVAPTAGVGHVLADGDTLTLCTILFRKFLAIRKDAADSVLSVSYLKVPTSL